MKAEKLVVTDCEVFGTEKFVETDCQVFRTEKFVETITLSFQIVVSRFL
jgi:hypothetical protein